MFNRIAALVAADYGVLQFRFDSFSQLFSDFGKLAPIKVRPTHETEVFPSQSRRSIRRDPCPLDAERSRAAHGIDQSTFAVPTGSQKQPGRQSFVQRSFGQ